MSQEVFIQRVSGQAQRRLLAQNRVDLTADVYLSVYTVSSGTESTIKSIYVCNRGTTGTLRLCHDENGTSYTEDNALFYDHTVTANSTLIINEEFYMLEGDSLGFSSGTADIFTVSIYGEEIQSRAR